MRSVFMMMLKYSCQVPAFPVDDVMWQKKNPCFILFSSIISSENMHASGYSQVYFHWNNFASCHRSVTAALAEVPS